MTPSERLNPHIYSENQTLTNQGFQKPGPGSTVKRWLRLNSFGGRLFWMIMLGALAGMGGMAFLFSEMLKRQAEDQVRGNIDSKVNAIASVTESAETLAYSLGVSATTLHERQAQFPDTYRELVLQLFEERPEFVVGLGLGQSKYGLIEDQPWLFPYYSAPIDGEANGADPAAIRYEDFADDVGEFYPDSDRYQDYFRSRANVWTAPYQTEDNRLLTYYYPMTDSDGDWLGSTLVDVDSAYLNNLLDDEVFQKAGNFLLVTRSGEVIANPQNPSNQAQTYQDIDGLADIWRQVNGNTTGFVKGDAGFWAYAPVPGQEWLLFGFVPYKAVYGRIVRIAAITTGLMGLLLATVVYLAIRKLNQRIKPILLQANQFDGTEQSLVASSTQHDELEQLSLSFFNMLNQINLHQETIRRHQETIAQSNLHADQVTERFLAFTAQINEESHEQQALLKRVQAQLAEQSNAYQILTEVEAITDSLNREARQVSDMLWGNLQQADLFIPDHGQGLNLDPENHLQSLDQAITDEEENLVLDRPPLQSLEQTIAKQEGNLPLDTAAPAAGTAADSEPPDLETPVDSPNTPGMVVADTQNVLEVDTDLQLLDQAITEEAEKAQQSELDDPWE